MIEMLPLLCERGTYPIILGDKGYTEKLEADLLITMCVYYRHGVRTRRHNIRQGFVSSMLNSDGGLKQR